MNDTFDRSFLALLETAIYQRDVLQLTYQSPASGIRSEREIEPLGIFFAQDKWVLVAFCRLRTERREFRLNGVQSLQKTGNTFAPHQFTFT